MDALLEELAVGLGAGSLACGADILWSEALHRRGAELHLFIPGTDQEFIEESVAPGGASWVKRYEELLAVSTTVTRVSRGQDAWEQSFRKTSEAMFACAIATARRWNVAVSLVSMWDGTETTQTVGTASDIALWRGFGLPVSFVQSQGRRVRGD
jgi:adenylate cyclase